MIRVALARYNFSWVGSHENPTSKDKTVSFDFLVFYGTFGKLATEFYSGRCFLSLTTFSLI